MGIEHVIAWSRAVGEMYGTENRSLFFYSLVRMLKPENILELGTGLGASAFMMAQAVRDNGRGHVWTVDSGEQWGWATHQSVPARVATEPFFASLRDAPADATLLSRAATLLDLQDQVSLLNEEMELVDSGPVNAERYPFLAGALKQPIDLLFADINTRPEACLITLRKYLPLAAESASLFFDSAPTFLPSYLALEQTVEQLNRGKVPAFLFAGTTRPERDRLHELIATRRFTLQHLTEPGRDRQNSMAWLRVEPVNIFPYPLTSMRGMLATADEPIPGESLREYLRTADDKDGPG